MTITRIQVIYNLCEYDKCSFFVNCKNTKEKKLNMLAVRLKSTIKLLFRRYIVKSRWSMKLLKLRLKSRPSAQYAVKFQLQMLV